MDMTHRTFERADQEAFAAFSGDRNPIHLDALAARRTIAGAPIVHGIHGLLWALDVFCADCRTTIAAISATFLKMLYLGDDVRLVVQDQDAAQARLQLVIDDGVATRIKIGFGERDAAPPGLADGPTFDPDMPLDPDFPAMATMAGVVPHHADAALAARLFPAASAAIGAERVQGLAASSTLVGMVCPGLHSIYDSIEVKLVEPGADEAGLRFATREAQDRFQRLRITLGGSGLSGSLVTFKRPAPATQPDMATLAAAVTPGEFAGVSALVVGGSRGLGELVGKLVAAGGGEATITYRHGEADAARAAAEIADAGGRCHVARYDVEGDAATQLAATGRTYTQVYYLATPPIFDKRGASYDPDRLRLYLTYYVDAFYRLCRALAEAHASRPAIFYPSSVAVETRPKQLTEYAMAKAAGEVLCADMRKFEKLGAIVMRRLPRLATDQTASIQAAETADATALMLEITRVMTAEAARG